MILKCTLGRASAQLEYEEDRLLAIPDYQTIMLPLLQYAADGQEHASRDPVEPLAVHFGLSEEELRELVPSGKPMFADRVAWALSYLRMAGVLQSSRRGFFRITERGMRVLSTQPTRIDNRLLAQFREFREFLARNRRPAFGFICGNRAQRQWYGHRSGGGRRSATANT
jgi:restriction system protein